MNVSPNGPRRWRWYVSLAILATCPLLSILQKAEPQDSKKTEKGLKVEGPPVVPAQIERAKQEVELLEAELGVKKSLLEEVRVRLEQKNFN